MNATQVPPTDEPPPGGSWRLLEAIVLAALVISIALLAVLTERGR